MVYFFINTDSLSSTNCLDYMYIFHGCLITDHNYILYWNCLSQRPPSLWFTWITFPSLSRVGVVNMKNMKRFNLINNVSSNQGLYFSSLRNILINLTSHHDHHTKLITQTSHHPFLHSLSIITWWLLLSSATCQLSSDLIFHFCYQCKYLSLSQGVNKLT